MKNKVIGRFLISLILMLLASASKAGDTSSTSVVSNPMCPNAHILERMIDGVCWSCMFPMRMAGIVTGSGTDNQVPADKAGNSPLCSCNDSMGIPQVGFPVGFWAPALAVEIVRQPGCSPILGGGKPIGGAMRMMGGAKGETGSNTKNFYHAHLYGFPLYVMLDLLVDPACNSDGYWDMSPVDFTEYRATWNDDEIALTFSPDAVLFSNPAATAIAAAEGVYISATAGSEPRIPRDDYVYWGAGTWGTLPPYSGSVIQHSSGPRETSLTAAKYMGMLHRQGRLRKTSGNDAQCGGYIFPTLPKTQYKMSMLYPSVEADANRCCHYIGESTFRWGEWRMFPGEEDAVYLIMRYTDCCIR